MSWITCDMRFGRTDEQKRQLAAEVIAAVRKATDEPLSNMVFVVREGVGVNFCEAGQHYPDYKPGGDDELIAHVKGLSKK
ncbi:phenylpyruvate tautomerase PptA (4-oxalocrotonate tautomerase family) [Bradyrhizobium sp. USDA 4461]